MVNGGLMRLTPRALLLWSAFWLIEAASDTHLFSQNYDRDFGDIFAIQDEVAEKVVDELHISLLGETPHAKRADPRAYALVLQARTMTRSNVDSEDDQFDARDGSSF